MHNLFLVHFVNLYMFRAYLGPSSGGTTVYIQKLVLIMLFIRLFVVLVGLELVRFSHRCLSLRSHEAYILVKSIINFME